MASRSCTPESSPAEPWKLAGLRQHRGLSQSQLAALLDVSPSTVAVWEGDYTETFLVGMGVWLAWIPLVIRLGTILGVDPLAIVECRRILRPTLADLPPPRRGRSDRRAELLPFVHWLRGALANRGWSPADLALRLDVTRTTVHGWALGMSFPNLSLRHALVETFREPDLAERLDQWALSRYGPHLGWTDAEEAILLAHPEMPAAMLARALGRTPAAVANHRRSLARRRSSGSRLS